jgi:hypothetical protein
VSVVFSQQVKPLVAMLVLCLGLGHLIETLQADLRGINGRDELQIAMIGGPEIFGSVPQLP